MYATPVLTDDETRVYRSCVSALMYDVLDRAHAQLEVGILGSYLRAPTTGAMEALRGVPRYLLGTEDACIKLGGTERESHLGGTGGLFRPRPGW